mgnify:CR=1 FL=1
MIMAFYPGVKIVEDAGLSDDFDLRLLIRYEEAFTILTVCKHGHECDKPDDLQEVPELPAYKDKLLISTCGLRAKILARIPKCVENGVLPAAWTVCRPETSVGRPDGSTSDEDRDDEASGVSGGTDR